MNTDIVSCGPVAMTSGQAKSAYDIAFGHLPDGTRYYDPWAKADLRPRAGFKALDSSAGGAGTAGNALIPIYVDERIVDQSRKYTPVVELLPRVSNRGLTADFNVVTAKGSAFVAAEDAALSENNDTYDRKSVSIKYLYAVGRVTGPAMAAIPNYVLSGFQSAGAGNSAGNPWSDSAAPNGMQLEVLMKARALKELEEDLLLTGDDSADANEFDGLVTQINADSGNVRNLSGAALTWDDFEASVEAAYVDGGRPNLAVCSPGAFTQLRKIMVDQFRYSPSDIAADRLLFGVPSGILVSSMVGPILCVPSMFLSNSADDKQIVLVDTSVVEVRVLLDMSFQRMGVTSDAEKFYLKQYEALIIRAPAFCALIDNID